ncbi:Tautomerase/MIF [Periconia macrospinosa]|uniref:L-dopachrome isomerase n=1 Tax=Periconia macrospinosa TaxID=97972 RepID=A0A2V1DQQ8_9PLEO|nr:Tautomerase/MIF [Periconia macrospinosa]
MAAIAARNPLSSGPIVQPTGGGSRRRTQYYEEQFAYKDDSISSARDRVTKDAPIVAELRTNVIIKDEYTLVTDLSHHLSVRYQRPESSIMITVSHSACLLLGGSFEPTYVLSITALPVQLQPTTNKRNAALVQAFMFESIGVPADRGIIKFIPIEPECFATNGCTLLGEIERLERQSAEENGGLKRALTKGSRRAAVNKAKSSFQLSRNDSKANAPARTTITPPIPSPGPFDSGVAVDQESDIAPLQSEKRKPFDKSSTKTKSMRRLNEKSAGAASLVTEDLQQPRISKRKSFVAMFRR